MERLPPYESLLAQPSVTIDEELAGRVRRLSRVRDVLSAVNEAILHVNSRGELFQEVVRIAYESGGFCDVSLFTIAPVTRRVTVEALIGRRDRAPHSQNIQIAVEQAQTGRTPVAVAVRTAAPAVCNDIAKAQIALIQPLDEQGIRSIGCFPLVVNGRLEGAMTFGSCEVDYFDEDEVSLLARLARNVSYSLERLDEHARLARLNRVRTVLSGVNAAIVRVRERAGLYREACRIAFEAGGFTSVFAFSVDFERKRGELEAVNGRWADDPEPLDRVVQLSTATMAYAPTIIATALRTRRVALVNDLEMTPAPRISILDQVKAHGTRASGVFPLVVDGRLIGAMVFDTAEVGFFDSEETELLESLTNNLAFALDRIRQEERVARLSRIRDVLSAGNATIVRVRDRDQLIADVTRIALENGGFRNVFVAETDIAAGTLKLKAHLGVSDRVRVERALQSTFADTKRQPGAIMNSLVTQQPFIKNDLRETEIRPVYHVTMPQGVRAVGSFPLVVEGRAIGAMVFESEIPGYFDEEEISLLSGLVNNLAFGLDLLGKQERVRFLSHYDALTGLPNRALFYGRLAGDLAAAGIEGKQVGLAVLDVSRFSVLNNTLGELAGDEVLCAVAERLRGFAAENRLARMGGDRFLLSFPLLDDLAEMTDFLAEDGVTLFAKPLSVGERELRLMVRAGCAVYPNDGRDVETLVQSAEAALMSAKARGDVHRFYAPEINVRLTKQVDLEARLLRAIDEEQFVLHYQPKVELATRRIAGFEALLRWNDPERGLIRPGEFVPFLEKIGLIVSVGRWALGESVRQYEEWRAEGLRPAPISVNVSAVQLRQERFVDDVRAAVERFSEECALELEVVESILMENFDDAAAKLQAIRALGVRLALDDFGTGYSSLSYLHRLPLNALKIDQSFVAGMGGDANKTSIVSTIISLARGLRLDVIAEGVETEEQSRLLRLLRCDQIQGYIFGPPEPAEAAARLLRTNVR